MNHKAVFLLCVLLCFGSSAIAQSIPFCGQTLTDKTIELECAEATVTDLSPLKGLPNLKDLSLMYVKATDFSPLKELKSLKKLNLVAVETSDFSFLKEMKTLEELTLGSVNINDLSPLADLQNLKVLYLGRTKVTDLTPLQGLKNLRKLEHEGNYDLPEDTIKELKKALPKLKVKYVGGD